MTVAALTRVRLTAVLLAAVPVGAGLLLAGSAGLAVPRAAAATPTCPGDAGSAVTKNGAESFASLQVTVCQTSQLVNQVVTVLWSGGEPTVPVNNAGRFQRHFLQIMQCWGDDSTGPRPEQCQWGGLSPDTARGGVYVNGRQVYATGLVDPNETHHPPPGGDRVWVPFESVTGVTLPDGKVNELYDANTTNQVTFARNRPDGTGIEFFEMQTGREAPGLGCGEVLPGGKTRACWLVVVPRSDVEVDGRMVAGSGGLGTTDRESFLQSSPLSASNWDHRIVFPLAFSPLGSVCQLGSAEQPTLGDEMITEAVTRWQPGLCRDTGVVYSFGQVSDELARTDLLSDDPSLGFITRPLPADERPAAGKMVYAPVAISGLAISLNIDQQSLDTAPPDVQHGNGQRIDELKLTPRVAAKLLTQSYRAATNAPATIPNNPLFMDKDPDFLADNPRFKDLALNFGIKNLLAPVGSADVYGLLWAWIAGDQESRDFLDGKADPWGAVVNPNYKGLAVPRFDLPKSDLACQPATADRGALCPADNLPSTLDMHEATRAASRGDWLVRADWDPGADPPVYKKSAPQPPGARALLAVSDTATATRYSLPTVQLLNAAGNFVAPTTQSLLAGVASATSSGVPGVVEPNPRAPGADVYPLTTITYAATAPSALNASGRHAYAAFLRYAAGAGQHPGLGVGDLPAGYVPLTAAMRQQTRAAATTITNAKSPPAGGGSQGGSGGSGGGGGTGPSGGTGTPGGTGGAGSGSTTPPGGAASPPAAPPPSAPPASSPAAAAAQKTPDSPVGAIRYVLPWVLIAGAVCAGVSWVLRFTARARPQKQGVMPTPDHTALPSV